MLKSLSPAWPTLMTRLSTRLGEVTGTWEGRAPEPGPGLLPVFIFPLQESEVLS